MEDRSIAARAARLPGLAAAALVASLVGLAGAQPPLFLAAPVAEATAAGRPAPAERPTYAVGARWVRSDRTWELVRIEGDIYVFTAGPGEELHLGRNLGIAKIVRAGLVEAEFDVPLDTQWPLVVGRWGTSIRALRQTTHRYGGGGREVRHTWSVAGHEEITVPAGTFRAFRIDHEITGSPNVGVSASGNLTMWAFTTWFAPALGQFVKGQGNLPGLTFELAAPAPALAAPAAPPAGAPAPGPPRAPVLAVPAPPAPPAVVAPEPPPAVAADPATDREAPRIVINYPPADAKVEREQIVILGLVTDNVAVGEVQVTVNGVVVPGETVEGRGGALRVPAALRPGENVVEVTARDGAGNVAQVVRTVTRVAPGPAGPPPPRLANRFAVVIGVGEYEHQSISPLRYATRDAEAMYRFLTTRGGYPEDNVVLLTDATAQKPTLQNIRRALGDFLYRKPAREDMVLIYYAGHGAPEIDAAGVESDGITKYLVPRNADPESLYSTALPMDEIQRIFGRIQAERVVLLLDTCYSGTAGGRTFARQQMRSGRLNDHFLERLTRSKGRVIITAAGPNEVALETSELGHGVFTYYLLEGLQGRADRDGDGIVTIAELYEYVEHQVDRRARASGGRQRPLMKGEIEGTLPLSKSGR